MGKIITEPKSVARLYCYQHYPRHSRVYIMESGNNRCRPSAEYSVKVLGKTKTKTNKRTPSASCDRGNGLNQHFVSVSTQELLDPLDKPHHPFSVPERGAETKAGIACPKIERTVIPVLVKRSLPCFKEPPTFSARLESGGPKFLSVEHRR